MTSARIAVLPAALAVAIPLITGNAAAQQPDIVNARVVSVTPGASLQQTFAALLNDQGDAAWAGYTVPAATGNQTAIQSDGWSERCRLEQTSTPGVGTTGPAGAIRLEPLPTMMVLFRIQNRQVQKIRTYSSDCRLDAGGLPLLWLGAVSPAQSVALLKAFAGDAADKTRWEPALSAIALHKDPAASDALFDFAKNGAPRIRERALVWIAWRAESRAAVAISDAIERDPDVEVQKQAVFALSQLPNNEGIPLLINLARTNANPAICKQAFFWLGRSKDPRALTFFEEVLR